MQRWWSRPPFFIFYMSVVRGVPKSGRVWKRVQTVANSQMKIQSARLGWDKRQERRKTEMILKQFKQEKQLEKEQEKEKQKQEALERKKRREENEKRAELIQKVMLSHVGIGCQAQANEKEATQKSSQSLIL